MTVVILARQKSSRYPRKHLHPINSVPLLWGIVKNVIKAGHVPVLCTGPLDDNREYAIVAAQAGAVFYCEEEAPEWDLVSRMVNMAERLHLKYWATISGDCPFSDFSVLESMQPHLEGGTADTVSVQAAYSTVIGDRALTGATAKWYLKMHRYYDLEDRQREQPWVGYPFTTSAVVTDGSDRTVTPIKTSIDWPLEGAIADLVVRHLGYWPKTDADLEKAYTEITVLNPEVNNTPPTLKVFNSVVDGEQPNSEEGL